MEYQGIVLTGTSGAGKSTISLELCRRYKKFQRVKAITTRGPRQNDVEGEYKYVNRKTFDELNSQNKLLIMSEYRGKKYGITYEAFQQVVDNGKIPVLVITPESVNKIPCHLHFFKIFLDASDKTLDERLRQRGDTIDNGIKRQREEDRNYVKEWNKKFVNEHTYVIYTDKKGNVEDIVKLIHSLWCYRHIGGMCNDRLIKLMIKCGMLLDDANLDNIQGASYDLVLGDEYFQNGKIDYLREEKPFIVMKPGDYVIVSSKEIANMPRDIAGRFDISVSLFCKGVILSNGPQIDPGFRGRLFCLLFNTSCEEVQLKRGEHFATIEFIKLFEPAPPYPGRYQDKLKMEDYLPKIVRASAINELITEVENLKKEKWLMKILPLVISIFALIVAILTWAWSHSPVVNPPAVNSTLAISFLSLY